MPKRNKTTHRPLPPMKFRRESPFWNFSSDGVSQSLIDTFFRCREEFRLQYVEGMKPDTYKEHTDYGNLWHAAISDWIDGKLTDHKKWLRRWRSDGNRPTLPKDLETAETVNAMFYALWPVYVDRYASDLDEDWVAQERILTVPITLPSGRETILRGTVDGFRDGIVRERKTKSQINRERIESLLLLDIQSMLYLVLQWKMSGMIPKGIEYDIIRRPGTKPHVRKRETLQAYVKRLRSDVELNPDHYFIRFEQRVKTSYVREWFNRVLIPMVEEIERWVDGGPHFPGGANALNPRPWASEYAELIVYGDDASFVQEWSFSYETK